LTVALTLFLFDDVFLSRILPTSVTEYILGSSSATSTASGFGHPVVIAVAIFLAIISIFQLVNMFIHRTPKPVYTLLRHIAPFHIVNSYGLFAVMTTSRPEIVVEGSSDGKTWLPYEFKYKPGDLKRPPLWAQPHQPRLDWQMWFAALGNYQTNPWFVNFAARLLQGSPKVLALLKENPFPNKPPKYIRAALYNYHFTDPTTKRKEGAWWRRDRKGLYLPAISLSGA